MTMRPLSSLLCAVLFSMALSSHLRSFHVGKEYNWTDAQNYCKDQGDTLVTVYNNEDACEIWDNIGYVASAWFGLHRTENTTRWANGDLVKFSNSSVPALHGTQQCGAIDNNAWVSFDCTDKKPFMCYTKNKTYILIKQNKTWCEARRYCSREYHTDLVSIGDPVQNDQVIKKGMDSTAPFWIGLLHDEWEWDDGGCSAFRDWDDNMPKSDHDCTIYSVQSRPKTLRTNECTNQARPICSKGKVRIRLINKHMTWEKALNYCNENFDGPLHIESEEDQKLVAPMLECAAANVPVTGPVWMGLLQSRLLGFWFWTNGKIVDVGNENSNWEGGRQPEPPLCNHCGAISMEGEYEWSDQDCHSKRPFICEELL